MPNYRIYEYKDGLDHSVYRVQRRVFWFFWIFETRAIQQNWCDEPYKVICEWVEDLREAERYIEEAVEEHCRKIRIRGQVLPWNISR